MKMRFLKLSVFLFFVGATVFFGVSYFTSNNAASGDDEGRMSYYMERNQELEAELAGLEAELYKLEATYRGRISELEAALVESRGEYIYERTVNGVIITAYQGLGKEVIIPSTLDGHEVIAIGREAFRNTAVESVTISGGIRKLDWFAFSGCSALKKVVIPSSVTAIEYGAFDGCPSLVISCEKGSFAEKYAASYGIRRE